MQSDNIAFLAHFRLSNSRPPLDQRWKGGRDVHTFLRTFKTTVEDLPGVTPDLCWVELQYRVTSTAAKLLHPFFSDTPKEALWKAKAKYLRVWAETPRDMREILKEIIGNGLQVKAADFTSLIKFVAKLEEQQRQARLHGDDNKFDEAEVMLAIVAACLPMLPC